jgi:hypothetical protein
VIETQTIQRSHAGGDYAAPTAPTNVPIGVIAVALAKYHCHAGLSQATHTTFANPKQSDTPQAEPLCYAGRGDAGRRRDALLSRLGTPVRVFATSLWFRITGPAGTLCGRADVGDEAPRLDACEEPETPTSAFRD